MIPPQDKWVPIGTLVHDTDVYRKSNRGLGMVMGAEVKKNLYNVDVLEYQIRWIDKDVVYSGYSHESVVNMILKLKKIARAKG